jgi:hypothetical protein
MTRRHLSASLIATLAVMILPIGPARAEDWITFSPISNPRDFREAKGFLRTQLDQYTINTQKRLSSDIWGSRRGTTLDKYLREFVLIAKADIDGDGTPERFLLLADPGFCGSAGCSLYILAAHNGRLTPLCEASGDEGGILLTDNKGFKGRREIETSNFHITWREKDCYVPELED